MKLSIHADAGTATAAAAELLASWLADGSTRTLMLAAGNTPLELYARIAERRLDLRAIEVFALDEYVGVPAEEARNCANLIRRAAIEPWGIPQSRYHAVSSLPGEAARSIEAHERKIAAAGGIDVVVLGLGQNGHLGFNEPGSGAASAGRVLDLDPISVEANRVWFGGAHAPSRGVTTGMSTILASRRVLLLAFGSHKRDAVRAMVEGPRSERCPASWLQSHLETCVYLDRRAAAGLSGIS